MRDGATTTGRRTARLVSRAVVAIGALVGSGLAVGGLASPAGAAEFDVISGADDGSPGTLRWAVEQAGLAAGDDVVSVDPSVGTITLDDCDAGRVEVVDSGLITVNGNGATVRQTCSYGGVLGGFGDLAIADLTITGASGGTGIELAGLLTLDRVTMTGNHSFGGGGAINAEGLDMEDSVITANSSLSSGGGVQVVGPGPATIRRSTISGNTAGSGGGISVVTSLELQDSTVNDNTAPDVAGIRGSGAATVDIVGSDVSGNIASGNYGAVFAMGPITITGSTITGNRAAAGAGAYSFTSLSLTDSTVAANQAGGGVGGVGGPVVVVASSAIVGNSAATFGGGIAATERAVVSRSTISGNVGSQGSAIAARELTLEFATIMDNSGSAGLDLTGAVRSFGSAFGPGTCSFALNGAMVSDGYNVAADGACELGDPTDRSDVGDLLLGPIGEHDGPTANHVPQSGSSLLDGIPSSDARCGGVDQRGFGRPQHGGCDIGAVEVRAVTATSTSVTTPAGVPVTIDLVPLVSDPDGVLSTYEVQRPSNGSVVASDGGLVTYTPSSGFSGTDSFDYIVCSAGGVICTPTAAVTAVVEAGPVAPVRVEPRFTG